MSRPLHVLVLCTGNSARSILGERLFEHLGRGRIKAFSAGSRPTGVVNPLALETLERHGIACGDARSKSWEEFHQTSAPAMDVIITVCANAANEQCPLWPGQPITAHWAIADPAHVEPLAARRMAFEAAYQALSARIARFVDLPLENLAGAAIAAAARRIHEEAGGAS